MAPVRIGAVGYHNARPLTWALDRAPERWQVRYDLPSVCARLLYDGEVDLGLVPSIEYLRSDQYRFVPGVGIGSRGPVASVALFTRRPIGEIRHIAIDTSSRTSVTLIKILCHHRFRIQPEYVPHGPDLAAMVRDYDAGLLIGDPALEGDPASHAVTKIDLGKGMRPMGTIASPDGKFVYVTTGRSRMLLIIDTASNTVVGSVDAGDRPWGVAISTDGKSVFTANGPADNVSVIDVATRAVVKTVPVGRGPRLASRQTVRRTRGRRRA